MPNHKHIVYQIFTRLFGNTNLTNISGGTIEQNGAGKFNDITAKALAELKRFGVSHVWYTGVIEHATMTDYSGQGITPNNPLVVKGRAGSPYAITDYYDVNPDLAVNVPARMTEFENLIFRTHQAGLQVIIDFVPNHLARQYHSNAKPEGVADFGATDNLDVAFDPQNNFYYLPNQAFVLPEGINIPADLAAQSYHEYPAKATGNDVFWHQPSINDWYETIKLNYGIDYQNGRVAHFDPIPDTWFKMRDILLFWAQKGVDGFRCDMAEMVPVAFWAWAIDSLKAKHPALIFIAEVYNPAEYQNYIFGGKFDYLYDKVGLYDALRRLMEGHGHADDITRVWQNESGDFSERMLRFLENHDEQRIASRFFANDPFVAIPAMALSATLHGGPLMLYAGQEFGVCSNGSEGFSGDDGRTTIFDYWGVAETQKWVSEGFSDNKLTDSQKKLRNFYAKLNMFVVKNEAVVQGAFYDLQYTQTYNRARVFSFLRYTANQKLLIICNFDLNGTSNFEIQIPDHARQLMGFEVEKKLRFEVVFSASRNESIITMNKELFFFDPCSVKIFEIC